MTDISYERLVEKALLHVVIDALKIAEKEGLYGNNHFYITFQTQYPGVILSSRLTTSYPDEITIVLQHEFTNLEVTDSDFSVTLSFGNIPERITVPFAALIRFADPHAQFAISFTPVPPADEPKKEKKEEAVVKKEADEAEEGEKIISLSAFRKKK